MRKLLKWISSNSLIVLWVCLLVLVLGTNSCYNNPQPDPISPTNYVEVLCSNCFYEAIEYDNVIVDFWAVWCKPCFELVPILEQLAEENQDIKIFKINIDENKDIYNEYRDVGIPMVIFFNNGIIELKSIGLKTFDYYQNCIDVFFE